MDLFLRVESADISLLGGREENQDRVSTAIAEHAALLVVVDGMLNPLVFAILGRLRAPAPPAAGGTRTT